MRLRLFLALLCALPLAGLTRAAAPVPVLVDPTTYVLIRPTAPQLATANNLGGGEGGGGLYIFTASDFNETGSTISIDFTNGQKATSLIPGYLSAADWIAFNAKAPTASPTFTGIPIAPTADTDTNTTQIATTAFVIGQSYLKTSTAASTYQGLDSDLTSISALATTGFGRGLLTEASASTLRSTLSLVPGTNFLAYPTGTPTGSKFLRDDNTWQSIAGGGDALVANPLSQFAATTSAQLASVLSDEAGASGGFVRAGYLGTAATEAATAFQAADGDLTTYANITPSANVQSLLGAVDYSAMRTQLALVSGTDVQAFDADLSTYAGITPSANIQTFLGAANYAAMRTQLGLVISTDVQAYDSDLTTWGAIVPASGIGTFLATPSGNNLATALTSALPASKGGTGQTSLTANNIITGNGTGAVTFIAPGTSGYVLTSNGTAWTSAAPASGSGNITGAISSTGNIVATNGSGSIAETGVTITSNNIVTAGNVTANVGTFTTGDFDTLNIDTLNVTSLGSSIVPGANGGTGVANTGKTITLGGNVTMSGAYAFTGTLTANTSVTYPTSGTLATVGGNIGAATATTATASDNSTKVATTAYVDAAVAAGGGGASVPTNGLILWPTASIGSLPSGFLAADGTEGTLNMTAIEGGTWIQRTTGVAPTLSSATIGTDGTTLTINMSEAVSGTDTAGGGFALTASGGAVTLGDITGTSTLTATANRTIINTETVTLAYVPGDYVDAIGLPIAPFSGASVTNSSTQVGGGGGATFSDTFNRANEAPLSGSGNWDGSVGSFATTNLVSNQAIGGGGNWLAMVNTSAATFAANQEASIVLASGFLSFVGPVVRIQSSDGSCYAAAMTTATNIRIYKFSGTTPTALNNGTVTTVVAGDVLKIKVVGTTITAYINGVLGVTTTDASYASGQPGIWGGDSIAADDFQADDV